MYCTLGEGFAGYNEWVIQKLNAEIVADFVDEYHKDAYAAERGVYIVDDVTPHIAVLNIPMDARDWRPSVCRR